MSKTLAVTLNGESYNVVIDEISTGVYDVLLNGIPYQATAEEVPDPGPEPEPDDTNPDDTDGGEDTTPEDDSTP